MRFPMHKLAFVIVAAAAALPGQEPWNTWLSRLKERSGPGSPWLLVLRPHDAQGAWWQRDEVIRRLMATREFRVETLTDAQGRDLSQQKGWKTEPRWLLFAPEGLKQSEGQGRMNGDRLLTELRELGFTPRWERREAFLKDHPDQGPARIEALEESIVLGQLRLQAQPGGAAALVARVRAQPQDSPAAALLDAVFKETAEALLALARVPLWWEQDTSAVRRVLRITGGPLPPALAEAVGRVRQQALEELQRDPGDENLWNLWSTLAAMTGGETRSVLEAAVRAPGQPWPPNLLVNTLAESYASKSDWSGLLEAMNALKRTGTRDPVDRETWDEARYAMALVEIQRARALARLGRWEESAAAVGAARVHSGQRWRGFLTFFTRRGIPEAYGERKTIFQAFLEDEPLPDPPMPPAPPRLRLLRLGAAHWAGTWDALAKSEPLSPWSPAELVLDTAPSELERNLRARYGWTGPVWALLAGDELLASGEEMPAAGDFAQRLAGLAPSRLQRLDRFLELHPSHKVARRLRLELLRSRMPNRHLEAQLAEDARQLRARIKAGDGWTPESALWQWTAQQVLPALETDLEHWPDQPGLWRDWVAWSRLHPRQPSALLLARRLPLYGMEAAWSSRLPAEVHRAVAEELRAPGHFEQMRQWFQSAWDGVDKQTRRRGSSVPQWLLTQRRNLKEAIVDPLREALIALRRDAEVVALDREVAAWLGEEGRIP
jgi:hypothetical protein